MPRLNLRLFWAFSAVFGVASGCDDGQSGTGGQGGFGGSTGTGATSWSTTSTGPTSSTGSVPTLPEVFTVTGLVTDGNAPLEGAIVMQAGGEPTFVTGPDGTFSIELTQAIPGTPTVVAAKERFRTRGVEFFSLPTEDVVIELLEAKPPDNGGYPYGEPGTGDAEHSTQYCDHCHTLFVAQFGTSAHEKSAKDPLVQDVYAGVSRAASNEAMCTQLGGVWQTGLVPGVPTDAVQKCYVGGGVLPDLNPQCGAPGNAACDDPAISSAETPTSFGGCADCHAPALPGKTGGRNLHDAVGLAYDSGNHCDFCHHIADVDLTKPAGVAGALIVQRPHEKQSDEPNAKTIQVMYGPLPDVPNEFMGGSYQPKYLSSELCGGCHEQRQSALLPSANLDPARWPNGLPVHDTFSEWQASGFNQPQTPCQFCHMPPDDTGLQSSVDVTTGDNASIAWGFLRPPERIRQHTFRGPLAGTPRLIDQAINLVLTPTVNTGAGEPTVTATVTVQNLLAGHAVPTGEPMRTLVLVVRAEGCNQQWNAIDGYTIFDRGGFSASGVIGTDITVNGTTLTWSAAGVAAPMMRVRVVRPSAQFDDYEGVGFFANPALLPDQKGLPIYTPVGEANVVSASNGSLVLDSVIAFAPGDIVYIGDNIPAAPSDGSPSLALAGASGYAFAKVLASPTGERNVHHYKAVDIVSDNRIPPQKSAETVHTFAVPAGCTQGKITATLLYRPVPVDMARLRGWEADDWVVGNASENLNIN
ncbi:MAG: hypothetical protein IPK82_16180 [Polyangiaceae bacterium]|nr:hypothetical protein [Polyangiaceae bacterium]